MDNNESYEIFCDDTKLSVLPKMTAEEKMDWDKQKNKIIEKCCSFIRDNR